jgi:hypothetical protein
MLNEQADILEAFKGKGDLVPIDPEAETIWWDERGRKMVLI